MNKITREIVTRALNGDDEAMMLITKEAALQGREVVIMQRKLQVHFYSTDGINWQQETVMWSPWHQAHKEPDYYIDTEEGRAFRSVRKEQRIELIPKEYMDPEGIKRILTQEAADGFLKRHKQSSIADLQKLMQEAIKAEEYERAAQIRDEIKARGEA